MTLPDSRGFVLLLSPKSAAVRGEEEHIRRRRAVNVNKWHGNNEV